MKDPYLMQKKNWDDATEKLGAEISDNYVSGVVNTMRFRTVFKDVLTMVFSGFGSVLNGFMK